FPPRGSPYVPNPAHDVSPDGKTLAWSGRLVPLLLDLETGRLRNEPAGHTGPLREAFFAPGGREVVTRSTDGLLLRWDPDSGRVTRQYDLPGRPESCMITADLKWIVAASYTPAGAQYTVHDAESLSEKHRITPTTGTLFSWTLVPDGKHVCFTSHQTRN